MILLSSTVFSYNVAREHELDGHRIAPALLGLAGPMPSLRAAAIGMYQDTAIAAPY
jgi:hypothetical protein